MRSLIDHKKLLLYSMLISILYFAQGCAVFESPLLSQGYEFGEALTHRLNFKETLVKSDIDEIVRATS